MKLALARVLLIRHCESTGQGFEAPLSARGHEQARLLAAWLQDKGVDRVVSSPFERAIDTILPFAKAAGIEVENDERLGERVLGVWFDSQEAHWAGVRVVMEDRVKRYGDGESGLEVTARGWPAVLEALDGANALTALISHGQMSSHLLREIDGTSGYDLWRAMTTPDVFELWRDDVAMLHYRRIWETP
jgi:2,3-bisphosphoglycerate-dependent phosphoglycerate mutase